MLVQLEFSLPAFYFGLPKKYLALVPALFNFIRLTFSETKLKSVELLSFQSRVVLRITAESAIRSLTFLRCSGSIYSFPVDFLQLK